MESGRCLTDVLLDAYGYMCGQYDIGSPNRNFYTSRVSQSICISAKRLFLAIFCWLLSRPLPISVK